MPLDSIPVTDWRLWLVGALFTLVVALGGSGALGITTEQEIQRGRLEQIQQRAGEANERIRALEEQTKAIHEQLRDIRESQKRIESLLQQVWGANRRGLK